jgi:hypothetical protein
MAVIAMPAGQLNSQNKLSAMLRERCHFLSYMQMGQAECEALAVAAMRGHAEAEFMIGSIFDAADEPARAMEWYFRSASRDYLPAMLQLFAAR